MSLPGLIIRKLSIDHAGLYRALMLRAYSEHEQAFITSFEERAGRPIEWWHRRLSDPTSFTLGAFDAHEALIGIARVELFQRLRERHKAELVTLYVMRDFAGKGVGRRLIEEALLEARKLKLLETMIVSVPGENLPMLRLLAKFGFLEFGREPKGIKLADRYLDRLMLWRPVSADYIHP